MQGAEREGGIASEAGSMLSAQSPMRALDPMICEIMTWAETKSRMFNWLSHPGAPKHFFIWSFNI